MVQYNIGGHSRRIKFLGMVTSKFSVKEMRDAVLIIPYPPPGRLSMHFALDPEGNRD